MTDKQIIGWTVGGSVAILAIALPVIYWIMPQRAAVQTVPPYEPQAAMREPGPSPKAQNRSRDATPDERKTISELAAKIETHAPQLLDKPSLGEADRRRIYLAMFQAIDQAEARGQNDYDYRPEMARRFGLSIEQVNSIAVEGGKNQWPDR